MASSQTEFFVGCILGGVLGASAALLMPKKMINGINNFQRNGAHPHRGNAHKGHVIHSAAKKFAIKKPKVKRAVKH